MVMKSYQNSTYGWDTFSKFLAVISLPFIFSLKLILAIIGISILGYSIWRARSTDFNKRRREEIIFENSARKLNYWLDCFMHRFKGVNTKIKGFFYGIKQKIGQLKWKFKNRFRYIVIKCPNCNQKLRVPRRKGRLMITCTKCSHKFKKRT